MLIQNQVGPVATTTSISAGLQAPARAGQLGDLIMSELHGRYYEQAYRRNLFYSWSLAQTLSASGTALTGNIIWNGSTTVNLVLTKIFLQVSVTSATMTGIALGHNAQAAAPTTTTVATASGNNFLGGATPLASAYNVGTVTTAPIGITTLLHNTAAINTVGVDSVVIDLEGSIIVPPNRYVSLYALGAASAASAVTSAIFWEEVPV